MTVECGVQGQHAWRLSPPLSVVRNTMTHTAQARRLQGRSFVFMISIIKVDSIFVTF